MNVHPIATLRNSLEALLERAAFNYGEGETRMLVRNAKTALQKTTPPVAHERPVGIFRYDVQSNSYKEAKESEAVDQKGELRDGYEYLFKRPQSSH